MLHYSINQTIINFYLAMLANGGGAMLVWEQRVYWKSLYLFTNFVVNLKLTEKIKD